MAKDTEYNLTREFLMDDIKEMTEEINKRAKGLSLKKLREMAIKVKSARDSVKGK